MKILFFGGRGWGFSQDMYDYVFKPLGATQHEIRKGVDWRYFFDVVAHDYDLIWCEGEASHLGCLTHYLFKTYTVNFLRRLYRSNRAKIVSRFHFHDVEPYLREFKWKAIMALTYSDQSVCVSEYWRREALRLLSVFKKAIDLKIVHNGVDTSRYIPNPSLKDNNVIFYLAVTTPRKRLHLLIQALKYLKDWRLIIGGKCAEAENETKEGEDPTIPEGYRRSKDYWKWCHKLSEPYRNRVEWTGFLSEEEKIQMYQRATVFCLPSRVESWGVTPMEAMACGTPPAVTNAGGLPEFVPKQQLIPAMPNPKDVAEKILEVSKHHEWNGLNREIAKNYDWKEVVKEINNVLNGVMTETDARSPVVP